MTVYRIVCSGDSLSDRVHWRRCFCRVPVTVSATGCLGGGFYDRVSW